MTTSSPLVQRRRRRPNRWNALPVIVSLLVTMTMVVTLTMLATEPADAAPVDCTDTSWVVATASELDDAIECYNNADPSATTFYFVDLARSITYPAGSVATPISTSSDSDSGLIINGNGLTITAQGSTPGGAAVFDVRDNAIVTFTASIIDSTASGAIGVRVSEGANVRVSRSTISASSQAALADDSRSYLRVADSLLEASDTVLVGNAGSLVSVVRSTLRGNTAAASKVAISNSTLDGSIDIGFSTGGTPAVQVANSTITGRLEIRNGTAAVVSTIVTAGCTGSPLTGRRNLGSGCPQTFGSATGAVAQLGDNGCDRQAPNSCVPTAALVSNSAALDRGTINGVVTDLTSGGALVRGTLSSDQRGGGFPRLFGTRVDIGAFEARQGPAARPQLVSQATSGGFSGGPESNDRFGASIAAGLGQLLVASPGEDGGLGAVALFDSDDDGLKPIPTETVERFYPSGATQTGAALAAASFDGRNDFFVVGSPGRAINGASDAGVVDLRDDFSYFFSVHADTAGVVGTAEPDDRFGEVLAVGDFDGDGDDDVAVGAPGESVGTRAGAGAVTIIYEAVAAQGNKSQLIFAGTRGIPGAAEAGDEFGGALAAGDFNNDGFDDLAIGAPGEAIGPRNDAGAVTVIYGSRSGLDPASGQLVANGRGGVPSRSEANDRFGAALAAGDLNSDGIDDLVIGSPGEAIGSRTKAGAAFVVRGSSGGLRTRGTQLLTGNSRGLPGVAETNDEFGFVLLVGDYDNDAINDLIIGSPGESLGSTRNSGAVIVIRGTGAGINTNDSTMIHGQTAGLPGWGEANDRFGAALALGRFDGIHNSLVIGIPGEAIGTIANAGAIMELAPVTSSASAVRAPQVW